MVQKYDDLYDTTNGNGQLGACYRVGLDGLAISFLPVWPHFRGLGLECVLCVLRRRQSTA
jgi:hypothetical protein